MIVRVFAYSRRGCRTARQVMACFAGEDVRGYTMEKFREPDFLPMGQPAADFYGPLFRRADALIFVGACGIAVRQIAPFVKSKLTDPAVLSADELGQFVIPLLSGHIGGANALALRLADFLGAVPVVTTATDIHGRFSVDAWAARRGYALSGMQEAKAVSAAILEGDVPMRCDFPVKYPLPAGVIAGNQGKTGICVSVFRQEPFAQTLGIIPPVLHLGLGCRRGTEAEIIRQAVEQVLEREKIDRRAIRCAASIDLKKDEQGLLQYCGEMGIPISFYSAEALRQVPGEFTPSRFVESVTGVDNVCERAAMVGAERLIVKKTACSGVTVALAAEKLEVDFG